MKWIGIARGERFEQHGYAIMIVNIVSLAPWTRGSFYLAIQVAIFHIVARIGYDSFEAIHLPYIP